MCGFWAFWKVYLGRHVESKPKWFGYGIKVLPILLAGLGAVCNDNMCSFQWLDILIKNMEPKQCQQSRDRRECSRVELRHK